MEVLRQQVRWSQLPSNLWAAIFSAHIPKDGTWGVQIKQRQCWFFALRTVCHTLNKVFEDCGDLNSVISVGKEIPGHSLLSLVKWLQNHQAHVKCLDVKQDSPWLETTLMALQSPHTCLRMVHFHVPVPQTAISVLSAFQSIRSCMLQSSHSLQDLNLQALSALPKLVHLVLVNGSFSHLEAAAHLTALSLHRSKVSCTQECSCVTSLVRLTLTSADLVRFHRENVAACLNLRSLNLKNSIISAVDGQEGLNFNFMDDDMQNVPSGLSALTALTSLMLKYPARVMNLDWVTVLSGLQSFQLEANQAVLPRSWSTMTNLQNLSIMGSSWGMNLDHQEFNLFVQFDWAVLTSLKNLELKRVVMMGTKVAGIASLPHLQKVSFEHLRNIDSASATDIALLAFDIGRNSPDVEFCMVRD